MREFLRRYLPPPVLAIARKARRLRGYRGRVADEVGRFASCENVHDLPPIYHYWSNRYLRPTIEAFGFSNPDAFFERYLVAAHEGAAEGPRRFVSIGAGNCETEVRLALAMLARGHEDFTIECLDLNAAMLERGAAAAQAAGVGARIVPVQQDFNRWQPRGTYHAVVANQALHHVLKLETLFDAIHGALARGGLFIASDIIGRNGHLRWPEARSIIDEFWRELPRGHRYNRQLSRQEDRFDDWDCSIGGFEGIRAQDILRLLIDRFHFDLFIGFANVVDPFIDRSFGPNFDARSDWDCKFIDRIHARDEAELCSGRIKPTHMFAVMRSETGGACLHLPGRSPAQSIRWPDA